MVHRFHDQPLKFNFVFGWALGPVCVTIMILWYVHVKQAALFCSICLCVHHNICNHVYTPWCNHVVVYPFPYCACTSVPIRIFQDYLIWPWTAGLMHVL